MSWSSIPMMILETLLMTGISTILAYLLGIPIGVILNITAKKGIKPNKTINLIIGTIVNFLRSLPCLIIIVLCMPITRAIFDTGTGSWYTILIPMTVCAFGFVARMVEQSLQEVPSGQIEAIKSLGATNFQIITKVLLPEARTSLITGVSVVAVTILGYTSFAYNIGAGGLISGVYSFFTKNTGSYLGKFYFWFLIILIVVLVQIIQELGLFVAKKLDKRRISK